MNFKKYVVIVLMDFAVLLFKIWKAIAIISVILGVILGVMFAIGVILTHIPIIGSNLVAMCNPDIRVVELYMGIGWVSVLGGIVVYSFFCGVIGLTKSLITYFKSLKNRIK